ncbi:MAG: cob(I)yrinic acid a,c-diamide adenosyltransferase [Actinobacteria bacterium]|nr:cob(I)yrinic acid a,c-diamide adenosyltransferase [Actinomycetota bacterium]MCB9388209.1 cob(I)yrinic acid a,c-diamide adenosyltransferase [Acidimicrobiia bacterium]
MSEPLQLDPRPDDLKSATSLMLVHTGNGKGKSSAAFGTMLRAIALEWPVAVVQFIKSGDWKTGEQKIAEQLGVTWHSLGEGFSWDSEDLQLDIIAAQAAWETAKSAINSDKFRLVILDEITYPLTWEWVDVEDVYRTLENRPEKCSLIATGRDAPDRLIDMADTVTDMVEVKHAYQAGIRAKKGIDY